MLPLTGVNDNADLILSFVNERSGRVRNMPANAVGRQARKLDREYLATSLAPVVQDVKTELLEPAPYALAATPTNAQFDALIDSSIDMGAPAGRVLGRLLPEGRVEVLVGWELVEAYKVGYRHARAVPVAVIEADDANAVFFAIEHAAAEHKAARYPMSPLRYALAADKARHHFGGSGKPWSITKTAQALRTTRPTLANKLRMIEGLHPRVVKLVDTGSINLEIAKILVSERDPVRQCQLADDYVRRPISTSEMYLKVHPSYQPPAKIERRRQRGRAMVADEAGAIRRIEERFGAPVEANFEYRGEEGAWIQFRFHHLEELKGILNRIDDTAQDLRTFSGDLRFQARTEKGTHQLLVELRGVEDSLDP